MPSYTVAAFKGSSHASTFAALYSVYSVMFVILKGAEIPFQRRDA